jgi:hypothetical protein
LVAADPAVVNVLAAVGVPVVPAFSGVPDFLAVVIAVILLQKFFIAVAGVPTFAGNLALPASYLLLASLFAGISAAVANLLLLMLSLLWLTYLLLLASLLLLSTLLMSLSCCCWHLYLHFLASLVLLFFLYGRHPCCCKYPVSCWVLVLVNVPAVSDVLAVAVVFIYCPPARLCTFKTILFKICLTLKN